MGLAFQAAVKAQLPEALIVFDRFHVMKRYSDIIRSVRKTKFSGRSYRQCSIGIPATGDRNTCTAPMPSPPK
jgi:transposase